jgi:hypothetical protein
VPMAENMSANLATRSLALLEEGDFVAATMFLYY